MENQNPNQNFQPYQPPYPQQPQWPPVLPDFFTGKREVIFAALLAVFSVALWNNILFGGLNLGAAVAVVAVLCCSFVYLLCSGRRPDWYTGTMLLFGILAAAGFARSDDGFVKFVAATFILITANLSFCLMAGQNRRPAGGVTSLLDAPRAFFMLGFGGMGRASRGLANAVKNAGTAGKRGGALALGLIVAAPVVIVMVFLLMKADAAFEGLMDLLPQLNVAEAIVSLLFGLFCGFLLYTRSVALHRSERPAPVGKGSFRGWEKLTVNTVLVAVCLVYTVYLLSQIAYFSGGFSGILPEGYTMAEYARRGFFEMAQLCAINLGVIWLACGLVRKTPKTPLFTRILCLFVGLVTIFLVCTASAKMLLYIGGYGLTRLRVLTEVIMVFLGITTALVCVWLFVPKLPYMKIVMVLALVLTVAVLWVDVDTLVASYNVSAYQAGRLKEIDVYYLAELNSSAVPWLQVLTEDPNPRVARLAAAMLRSRDGAISDFRGWNWSAAEAWEILKQYWNT